MSDSNKETENHHTTTSELNIDEVLDNICDGKREIVSFQGSSQYGDNLGTRMGASACGLAALNFARVAFSLEVEQHMKGLEFLSEILAKETGDEIISICDLWKSNTHLEIEELLKAPIFKNTLSLGSLWYSDASASQIFDLLRTMEDGPADHSVITIITRPPEIIACLKTSCADRDIYVIFDSHPRPDHPEGFAFVINPDIHTATAYLANLFAFDETILDDPSMQWQAQLLNYISGHILLPVETQPSVSELILDSTTTVLSAYAEIADVKARNSELREETKILKERQVFMEERIRSLGSMMEEGRERQKALEARLGYVERRREEERERYREILQSKKRRRESREGPNPSQTSPYGQNPSSSDSRMRNEKNDSSKHQQNLRSEHGSSRTQNRNEPSSASSGSRKGTQNPTTYASVLSGSDQQQSENRPRLLLVESPDSTQMDHHQALAATLQRSYAEENQRKIYVDGPMPHSDSQSDAQGMRDGEGSYKASMHASAAAQLRDKDKGKSVSTQSHDLLSQVERDAAAAAALQRAFEEEDRVLAAERARLQRGARSTFDCAICFDKYDEDFLACVTGCVHSFCRYCLKQFATVKIGERRFPIFCPTCVTEKDKAKSEHGVLDQTALQYLGISDDDYKIFEELQITSFSVPVHCRRCNETMFVDRAEMEEAKLVVCPMPKCNYTWCKACQREVEIGGVQHSCDGSSELQHLMQQKGWKPCPGCKTPVQKETGCNHMTCITPACNTHFCYLCGGSIIKGGTRTEIQTALSKHYKACKLFEY